MFTSALTATGSGANISDDGLFRYTLWRVWDSTRPPFVVIGLNPSTADASLDDPTIRRCIGFAKRESCGRMVMLNLFAFRSPSPKALKQAQQPVGPLNDVALYEVILGLRTIPGNRLVAAWGAHGTHEARDRAVVRMVRLLGPTLLCLGKTKDGHPGHPLYLSKDTPLEVL